MRSLARCELRGEVFDDTDPHRTLRLQRRGGLPLQTDASVRMVNGNEVEQVEALHHRVLQLATVPGLVKPESHEFFERHASRCGRILGVFVGNCLVAYAVVGLPVDTGYNFGLELELPEKELLLVAHLDGVSVAPEWRGNGLQRTLGALRVEIARRAGRHHLISTVAPRNTVSWRNVISQGLKVRRLKRKFGGALRYILHQDINTPTQVDSADSAEICLDDIEGQQRLLAQGYLGCAAVGREGVQGMRYSRSMGQSGQAPRQADGSNGL